MPKSHSGVSEEIWACSDMLTWSTVSTNTAKEIEERQSDIKLPIPDVVWLYSSVGFS